MNTLNLVVVGGGPIGLATAIDARLSGLTVVLLEPKLGNLDKACGEGLMPGALPFLDRLGVEPKGKPLRGVAYHQGQQSVTHRFAEAQGLGVRRLELHSVLSERASSLGVSLVQASFSNCTELGDHVVVVDSNGVEYKSRYVIGADGLHSSVARSVGLAREVSERRVKRYGLRQHFNVAPWSDLIEVFYTKEAEVYVTPVSSSEVGVAVLGLKSNDFKETVQSVPELAERLKGATTTSRLMGAGSFPQKSFSPRRGRVLLVGDASGYIDAITGEGLRLGLAQSREAIKCILNDAPDQYEKQWKRVSRNFRVLTNALVFVANSSLRGSIVPLASSFPRLFGWVVERLAK